MSRRALIALAVTAAAGGATFALAQDPESETPEAWRTRPEVPGVARTIVPFGVEATDAGPRTWGLGQAGGTTVLLRRAPTGAWTAGPLPARGAPVGGGAPQHAGESTPDGRAAVLLADPADPAADAALLTREPGGTFVAAPLPGDALRAGEQLVPDATRPAARAFVAVVSGKDDAATLIAPTDADGTGSAVLRFDADGWTREPFDAPGLAGGPVRPVGLAAASGAQAWLLGRSGDDLVLLQRRPVPDPGGGTGTATGPTPPPTTTTAPTPPPTTETTTARTGTTSGPAPPTDTNPTTGPVPPPDGDPDGGARMHWVLADVAPDALLGGRPRPDGVSAVTVAAPPADPLTATTDGLWVDLGLETAAGPADATLHLAVATGNEDAAPSRVTVDGRWCDVPAAGCDHPLGLAFPHGDRGYRSQAFPSGPGAPFGGRVVSSPVDVGVPAGAPRHDAERQGGYAALAGDRFVLRDGIGEDGTGTSQAVAFAADGRGVTGGRLAVGVAAPAEGAEPTGGATPLLNDPLVAAAPAPDDPSTVLAFTRGGAAVVHETGTGWRSASSRVDALQATSYGLDEPGMDARPGPRVRAFAWPRRDVLVVVGSGGLLLGARVDPAEPNDGPSDGAGLETRPSPLPVEATPLAVSCTRDGALECVTGGRAGLLVRGDGERWKVDRLPEGAQDADVTGVAYDGRTAVVATGAGVFRHAGDGTWTRDEDLRARMAAAGQGPGVRVIATEPGGGTVVDGLWERDAAADPWRPTSAPLTTHPVSIAAVRDPDGHVRTLVTGTPEPTPLPTPLPAQPPGGGAGPGDGDAGAGDDGPDDGDASDASDEVVARVPADPSPEDSVTLRETAEGWVDVERASYAPSGGRDLPATTTGTRVLAVDGQGTGWAVGGIAGNDAPDLRETSVARTTSFERLEGGLPAAAPPDDEAPSSPGGEIPVPAGAVRLAVGGHPACLDRCTGGAHQGTTPDVHLSRAVERVTEMRRAGAGPAALVVGGGRASVDGEPLDDAGARRYRELLEAGGAPSFVLPGAGDLRGGGAAAFGAAFSTAAAPVGTGEPPPDVVVDPALQPPAGPGGARTHFTFDVRAAAGTVRVVAIDNAAGRFEGGLDGPQATWLARVLADARDRATPVVVVGSAPLVGSAGGDAAQDAADEVELLAGRASAYVATAGVDDPADRHFGGVIERREALLVGADDRQVLPVLQSSTLGYGVSPARYYDRDGSTDVAESLRQTAAALLLLDVDVARRDPVTNLAPVATQLEPLLGPVRFSAATRVPLGTASPMGAYAEDPAPQRYRTTVDGTTRTVSAATNSYLPSNACAIYAGVCGGLVPDAVRFSSSDPSVGRFVGVAPGTDAMAPTVKTDATGRPLDDPQLGVFCPVGVGTTTVTIAAMGRQIQRRVTVERAGSGQVRPSSGRVPEGSCAFDYGDISAPEETSPADAPAAPAEPAAPAAPSAPVTPAPAGPVVLPAPAPPVAAATPAPAPTPVPTPALPPGPPAAFAPVQAPPAGAAMPPVSPAAKAPTPPAPPPPTGHAQVPQPAPQAQVQAQVQGQAQLQGQVQPAVRAAEQQRRREAFQSDDAAVAYDRPPSPLPWEIGGAVAAVLLAAGGGVAAGRRRRAAAPAFGRRRG